MRVKILEPYKHWKPVKHSVIKNDALAEQIHESGYAVIPFLDETQLQAVSAFYEQEHALQIEDGGMFYSLYSKDLAYRKRVHETLGEIFRPLLEEHFRDYKNIVNTFITKAPGPASEFYVHQDTTALDEYRYSPLSIWIPLQDITPDNGALGVIEKTHWFFSPYRGISFAQPFQEINDTVRAYLKPVYLKAGEALVFDPRVVHHSMPNSSGANRLVALCGIFPAEAEFITCFKNTEPGSKIELLKQEDTFILENDSFFYDCHKRPKTGQKVGEVEHDFPEMSRERFEELCALNGIPRPELIGAASALRCRMIAEPDGVNLTESCEAMAPETAAPKEKTVWQKLKAVFH